MKRPIAVLAVFTLVAALGTVAIAAPCDKNSETAKAEGTGCAKKADAAVAKAEGAGCAKDAKDCCAKKGEAAVAKDGKPAPKDAKATQVAEAHVEKK